MLARKQRFKTKSQVKNETEKTPASVIQFHNWLVALVTAALFGLAACGGNVGSSEQQLSQGSTSPPSPGPGSSPTLNFSANPTVVSSNGSTTLSWSATNASSCDASGGWSGTKAVSGTQTINSITSSNSYTLTCQGANGSVTHSVAVTVSASFTVDTSWAPNSDNPDGYLVYIGPSTSNVSSLAKVLAKDATDWSPASPSASLPSSIVLAAVGTVKQVCVAIRAYNAGGVSVPSDVTCAALP